MFQYYDLAGFMARRSSLRPLGVDELGDVGDKTLLHLMCHFGMDTLSLARRGARVTGSDFSEKAVELARSLAAELGLEARFVVADIHDLSAKLGESFEIVFTSWGVLAWLADLPRWGSLVAHFVKPGGIFYMAEIHPLAAVLEPQDDGRLLLDGSYLSDGVPHRYEAEGSYADPSALCGNTVSYQWDHSLAEVLTALIDGGLVIDFVHEWPFCVYRRWPAMIEAEDG